MKTYARIQDGVVVEIVSPMMDSSGSEIPVADRFHPHFVATLVDVSDIAGVEQSWQYDGKAFSAPAAFVPDWVQYQAQAKAALDASDTTMLRCFESAVIPPAEWASYRRALRAIVGAKTQGDPTQPLPTRPPYPTGT